MVGRDLSEKLLYTGMERAVRRLALKDELDTVENIAVMSELEICDLVMQYYEIVYAENENIGLVRNKDMDEYEKLVKIISR